MNETFKIQLDLIDKALNKLDSLSEKLGNLNKIDSGVKQLQNINESAKKSENAIDKLKQKISKLTFNPAVASVKLLEKGLNGIAKVLDIIYSKTKSIIFAGIGAIAGIGMWGKQQNESNTQAKELGLSYREKEAWENTATESGRDKSFFTDIYKNLGTKENDINDTSLLTAFGHSQADFKDLKNSQKMQLIIDEINKSNGNKNYWLENSHIKEALENATGKNISELETLKKDKIGIMNRYYRAYGESASNSAFENMGEMGSSFDRMLNNIKTFALNIANTLATPLKKVFDSISAGLANLKNTEAFQNIMDKMKNFFESVGNNASSMIANFFEELPYVISDFALSLKEMIHNIKSFLDDWTPYKYNERKSIESNLKTERKAFDTQKQQRNYAKFQKELAKNKGKFSKSMLNDLTSDYQKAESIGNMARFKDTQGNIISGSKFYKLLESALIQNNQGKNIQVEFKAKDNLLQVLDISQGMQDLSHESVVRVNGNS